MKRVRLAVVPLRVFLALLFALLLLLQTMSLPGQFAHMARESPADAHLRWPLLAWSVLLLLCVQVVIACTWKLLAMVEHDQIFSRGALRWVDAIVAAVAGAFALLGLLELFLFFTHDDPGFPLLVFIFMIGTAALGLLLIVMRALLVQATTLRTDLEGVI